MAHISMIGAGSVGETADFLREFFSREYALVEEKRRVGNGAGTAFLMFESSSLLTRGVELLALDISGDGKSVTVDAFGHACGSIWADEEALPLHTARALRERGFTEYERESWKVSGVAESRAENPGAESPEVNYVSPMELARLGWRCSEKADAPTAGTERAEPEKPKKRRGKRSYDPEL